VSPRLAFGKPDAAYLLADLTVSGSGIDDCEVRLVTTLVELSVYGSFDTDIRTDICMDIHVNGERVRTSILTSPFDHLLGYPHGYPCQIIRATDSSTREALRLAPLGLQGETR